MYSGLVTVMGGQLLGPTGSSSRPYRIDVGCPSCASTDCIRVAGPPLRPLKEL